MFADLYSPHSKSSRGSMCGTSPAASYLLCFVFKDVQGYPKEKDRQFLPTSPPILISAATPLGTKTAPFELMRREPVIYDILKFPL